MTAAPEDQRQAREETAFFYRGPGEAIADGVVFFPSFGTCTAFICDGRILLVDTTPAQFAAPVIDDLRSNHSQAPIETIIYTHGHIDHTTGAQAWLDDAEARGHPRPRIIAHRDLPARFDRYRLLAPQNDFINRVQFNFPETARPSSNARFVYPDDLYSEALVTTAGGLPGRGERFELYHARGETDDETWVWCPARRVLCTGDTFVWSSPNAGNPYKVQRYALDWAQALETMAALRSIHDQVVAGMNEGKWLEDILREIDYPPTDKPWLRPIYDHPEFIARNVYRLYGGWYNGDPADILPAHSHDIARELVGVCGAEPLLTRARALRDAGDPDGRSLQIACHIVDFFRKGDPDNREAWLLWRDLFAARIEAESSLMARGAFHSAVREAEARLKELGG